MTRSAEFERLIAQTRRRVMAGTEVPPRRPGSYLELADEVIFGDAWNRPGLTDRERRLITLSIAGADSGERGLATHMRAALLTGDLTPEELDAFTVHFGLYAGAPRAAAVCDALAAALKAHEEEPPSQGGASA